MDEERSRDGSEERGNWDKDNRKKVGEERGADWDGGRRQSETGKSSLEQRQDGEKGQVFEWPDNSKG